MKTMKSQACFTEGSLAVTLRSFSFSDSVEFSAVNDSVAVDAKRILLRYGAPISILDAVSEPHRIEFAREVAKTALPERQKHLRELLIENGYIVLDED